MKNGDLSNQVGVTLYVYLQDLLTPKEKLNILDKTRILLNKSELDKYDLVIPKVNRLNYMITKTSYAVKLITDDTKLFQHFSQDPFLPCGIVLCTKALNFDLLDKRGAFSYLVIDDTTHWYCFHTDRNITFEELLRIGGM